MARVAVQYIENCNALGPLVVPLPPLILVPFGAIGNYEANDIHTQ